MNIALRKPIALEEFLAWEREQERPYEFDGFVPVAMTGGTRAHSEIATNLVEALRRQLRAKPCRAYRGDLKIIVNGRVRYPDAVVTCTDFADDSDIVPEPVVVFEVLSESTGHIDRVAKNAEYRATASIQHYVLLEQTAMVATIFSREGEAWTGVLLTGETILALPAIGVELPLALLYDGVALPQQGD